MKLRARKKIITSRIPPAEAGGLFKSNLHTESGFPESPQRKLGDCSSPTCIDCQYNPWRPSSLRLRSKPREANDEGRTLTIPQLPLGGFGKAVAVCRLDLNNPPASAGGIAANGQYTTVAGAPFPNTSGRELTTPGDNGTGANDWVLVLTSERQSARKLNYDESKVPPYTLPDPLVMASGAPVKTAQQWRQRRRPEILRLFETQVYGRMPGRPVHQRFEVKEVDRKALAGRATRKQVTIHFTDRKDADVEFKNNMPKDGGDWYYKINGTRVSVKEMGGWNIQHNYQGTNMSCLTLTLKPEWLLAGDQQGLSRKA